MRSATVVVLVAVGLAAAVGTAAGAESEIHVSGEDVETELSFVLHANDEPLNYWEATVSLPEDARVESVRDTDGETDYTFDDGRLEFETNTGVARDSERVTVEYVVEDAIVEEFGGLRVVEVGVVGLGRGDGTTARVTADDDVLSASAPHGFEAEFDAGGATFEGRGSKTVRVAVGEDDGYENYAVFGDADLSEADELHRLVAAAFGFEAPAHRHPVVFLGDDAYEEYGTDWSNGHLRAGGVILVRDSVDDVTKTVLHETAHAYNAVALSWTDASVGWFDEGTATYVEFLVDRKRGEVRRPLFSGERYREEDGEFRAVGPRGELDELVGYYEGDGFMRGWTAADDENRRFGYAFAELAVRGYVADNGASALHDTYDKLLNVDDSAESTEEATAVILDAMDTDLRPCAAPSREETADCLEDVNTMEATVPAYDGNDGKVFEFNETEIPERNVNETDERGDEPPELTGFGVLASVIAVLAVLGRRL